MSKERLRKGRSRSQVNSSTFLFCVNNIGKEFEDYFIVKDRAKPDNNVMYYVSCIMCHDIKVRNLFFAGMLMALPGYPTQPKLVKLQTEYPPKEKNPLFCLSI
jgi:hypothetical protein